MASDLVEYYRRRAGEYESIYARPERQADLAILKQAIPERLRGRRVLEVACGTGYWTPGIAATARSVVATDLADETLQIAREKAYPGGKVSFRKEDAFQLPAHLGSFDGAFAGFLWSHLPRRRQGEFVASLLARLEKGARVLILDNTPLAGSERPLSAPDEGGDTWQERTLADGSRHRVLKNYPDREELRACFPRMAFSYRELRYYWLAEVETP